MYFFPAFPTPKAAVGSRAALQDLGEARTFPHLFAFQLFSFKQQLKSSNLLDYKFPNSPDPEHGFYSDAGGGAGEKVTTGSINIIWGDGAARGRGRRQSAH